MPLVLNGTTGVQDNSGAFVAGTAVTSTSGTSIDFTSIPSWVKRVTVVFNGVSVSGTSQFLFQLGDSGGIENTGYSGLAWNNASGAIGMSTAGFSVTSANASASLFGMATFTSLSGNLWVASICLSAATTTTAFLTNGSKELSATLDRVRITTISGTDTFDAGSINILYE